MENYFQQLNTINSDLKKYLDYLHDSNIIKIKKEVDSIVFILDDYTLTKFAYEILEKENRLNEAEKLMFPISLVFEKISHFSINKILKSGRIKKYNTTKLGELKCYLYEELLNYDENRIEIALAIWSKGMQKRIGNKTILISAKKINIIENQKFVWKKLFGSKYDGLYNEFMELRKNRKLYFETSIQEFLENKSNTI